MRRFIVEALSYVLAHRHTIVLVKFGSRIAPHAETRGLTKSIRLLMEHGIRFVLVCPKQEEAAFHWPSLNGMTDHIASEGICSSDTVHAIANSCLGGQLPVVTMSMLSDELLDDAIVTLAQDLNANLASHPRFEAPEIRVAKIIFLTHESGILDSQERLIRQMDLKAALALSSTGRINGGMRTKLAAAIRACREVGIGGVHIVSGKQPDVLFGELLTATGVGTMVYGERVYPSVRMAELSDAFDIQQIIAAWDFDEDGWTLSFEEVVAAIAARKCHVATLDGHIQACGMLHRIPGTDVTMGSHFCGVNSNITPESLQTLVDTKFGELARYGMGGVLFPALACRNFPGPGMSTPHLPTDLMVNIKLDDVADLGINADELGVSDKYFVFCPLKDVATVAA